VTHKQATLETKKLFGEDSFTEYDDGERSRRYYVGRCPTSPGVYQGFMGYSWEEVLDYARGGDAKWIIQTHLTCTTGTRAPGNNAGGGNFLTLT